MRWAENVRPVPMRRVAIVAPRGVLRDALVTVADAGCVQLERAPAEDRTPSEAARRLQRLGTGAGDAQLSAQPPDLGALERAGRRELLAGEAELAEISAEAVRRGSVAALLGWVPEPALEPLGRRLAPLGAAAVPLARPRGVQPPTLLRREGATAAFAPLVQTYTTVPYRDIDPSVLAGVAYVVMFGVMFGDVGHGLVLLLMGLLLASRRVPRLQRLARVWPFLAGAGLASMAAGLAYGEAFGSADLLPGHWIDPLAAPVRLMAVAIGLGGVLLALAYLLGSINRVREGGLGFALYAPSGLAGATLFLGGALAGGGWYLGWGWTLLAGALVAVAGLVLSFIGLRAAAGPGGGGVVEAAVELVDLVLRLGANVLSFARLAAFGLTHAALGALVWDATHALWSLGGAGLVAAVLVVVAGNALTFTLEAVVAGIQALRLEYYELFSRVFDAEGRPFRPWVVPTAAPGVVEEAV